MVCLGVIREFTALPGWIQELLGLGRRTACSQPLKHFPWRTMALGYRVEFLRPVSPPANPINNVTDKQQLPNESPSELPACLSAACVSKFCVLVWPKEKPGEATTPLTIADLLGSVLSQMLLESPWPCQSLCWGVWVLWGGRDALGVMEIRNFCLAVVGRLQGEEKPVKGSEKHQHSPSRISDLRCECGLCASKRRMMNHSLVLAIHHHIHGPKPVSQYLGVWS